MFFEKHLVSLLLFLPLFSTFFHSRSFAGWLKLLSHYFKAAVRRMNPRVHLALLSSIGLYTSFLHQTAASKPFVQWWHYITVASQQSKLPLIWLWLLFPLFRNTTAVKPTICFQIWASLEGLFSLPACMPPFLLHCFMEELAKACIIRTQANLFQRNFLSDFNPLLNFPLPSFKVRQEKLF